jgi:hypothetical protein
MAEVDRLNAEIATLRRQAEAMRAALEREAKGATRAKYESHNQGREDWARHFARMETRIAIALGAQGINPSAGNDPEDEAHPSSGGAAT